MYFSKQLIFSSRSLKTVSLFVFVVFSYLTQAAEYQSHKLEGNGLVVLTDQGKVTLTANSAHSFEVFYQPTNTKQLPSFALVDRVVVASDWCQLSCRYLLYRQTSHTNAHLLLLFSI